MPKRFMHNLSHYRLLTHEMGQLVPCGVTEVLPGDVFNHRSQLLMRVQPLLKPLMHPVECRIHHWYVPNRLLWDQWDAFITKREDLTLPTINYEDTVSTYDLLDHLGVPAGADQVLNALPIRAYNAVYNHAYRDQNIHTEVTTDSLALQYICWEKDYFTTARAEPQFGSAAIDIPFSAGTEAPVSFENQTAGLKNSDDLYMLGNDILSGRYREMAGSGGSVTTNFSPLTIDTDDFGEVTADLSQVSGGGINVNDLRQAIAQQKFLEHRNRYGSRHEDYLRYLGIRPSDARIQNPEYLGGGSNTISFSEVLSTSDTTGASVGDLAGHGISALSTRPYRRMFEESGIVISLLSVRPKAIYMEQLHRLWLRRTADDFWQKEYEAMGPQAVLSKELYALHANATDILGYNGRHDEYRHIQSYVSGKFRAGESEADWHLGRDFSSTPALNTDFLNCIPTDRVYADTVSPELYSMVNQRLKAKRLVRGKAQH